MLLGPDASAPSKIVCISHETRQTTTITFPFSGPVSICHAAYQIHQHLHMMQYRNHVSLPVNMLLFQLAAHALVLAACLLFGLTILFHVQRLDCCALALALAKPHGKV